MKPQFISSVCMVICSYRCVVLSVDPKRYLYALGILTSVLNHGFGSRQLQILDRGVMFTGAIVDIYSVRNFLECYLLIMAIVCYFLSKISGVVSFHIGSHIFVTVLHNRLMF